MKTLVLDFTEGRLLGLIVDRRFSEERIQAIVKGRSYGFMDDLTLLSALSMALNDPESRAYDRKNDPCNGFSLELDARALELLNDAMAGVLDDMCKFERFPVLERLSEKLDDLWAAEIMENKAKEN